MPQGGILTEQSENLRKARGKLDKTWLSICFPLAACHFLEDIRLLQGSSQLGLFSILLEFFDLQCMLAF
jgi:hypothetical protein